jgi:hypothetical protein
VNCCLVKDKRPAVVALLAVVVAVSAVVVVFRFSVLVVSALQLTR